MEEELIRTGNALASVSERMELGGKCRKQILYVLTWVIFFVCSDLSNVMELAPFERRSWEYIIKTSLEAVVGCSEVSREEDSKNQRQVLMLPISAFVTWHPVSSKEIGYSRDGIFYLFQFPNLVVQMKCILCLGLKSSMAFSKREHQE